MTFPKLSAKFLTSVNNEHSHTGNGLSGVPQGLVLGPLLLLLYINDWPKHLLSGFYADNVILYREIHSEGQNILILKEDLLVTARWAQDWLMILIIYLSVNISQ